MRSLILRTAVRMLQPLLLLYSVFLLVAGHNQPGGGFVGGLVAAAALAVYAIAHDAPAARALAIVHPRTFLGAGLVLAVGSGMMALVAGRPLMTGLWTDVPVLGMGTLALGTPLLFDVGVYLVVIGVTLLVVFTLVEE
jgi:multicomponent Na+:H+ antiporter subunit B